MLALITASCLVSDSMLYVILPLYWQDVGLTSLWEVGFVLSVNRLIRLFGNPFAGWAYSKVSIRMGMLIATALAVFCNFGYAYAGDFRLWCLLRMCWGMAWAFFRIGALALILEIGGHENGFLVGRYNGLFRIGSLVGMLGGGLLADYIGFSRTALIAAALTLPALLMAFTVPRIRIRERKQTLHMVALIDLGRTSGIFPALVTVGVIALVLQGVLASGLGPLAKEHFGDVIPIGSVLLGCATFTGIMQACRWGAEPVMAHHFGRMSDNSASRTRLLAVWLSGSALVYVCAAYGLPTMPWVAVIIVMEFTAIALNTLGDAVITDMASKSDQRMPLLTAYTLVTDIGAAIGPAFLFYVGTTWDFSIAYGLTGMLMLAMGVYWMMRRGHDRNGKGL